MGRPVDFAERRCIPVHNGLVNSGLNFTPACRMQTKHESEAKEVSLPSPSCLSAGETLRRWERGGRFMLMEAMQTNCHKCRQFRYSTELHRETKAWVSGAFTALPSVGRKVRYRHKVDGIWHSDNGECSYRNCLPKSILLGLIGLGRGAKSALQRLHWLFPHTFFIPIYHWYHHHQSNTPTANTCRSPRISPT